METHEKILLDKYLPANTRISIEEQTRLIERAVKKAETQQKLAEYLCVAQQTIAGWKSGKARLTADKFEKMKQLLNETKIEKVCYETHKRTAIKISEIRVSREFTWFVAIRYGDRDEDEYSVGVGTTDVEIAVEFIRVLGDLFNLQKDGLYCAVTSPKEELSTIEKEEIKKIFSCKLGLPEEVIRVKPRGKQERNKKFHIAVRYYNKLLKSVVSGIENDFNKIIKKSDKEIQGAYISGLIDSEGTVKDSGRVVIEMRPKSYNTLKLASEILENLDIRHSFAEDKKYDLVRLTIYPNPFILKFCRPIHLRKRAKLS